MPTSRRTIVVPEQFPHVGFTSPRSFSDDPRKPKQVATDIDMRACEFIGSAAVVWCAVYALLAKHQGCETQLLVPPNLGVCVYLKSTGLFGLLQQAGVTVDDRGIREQEDRQVVLALSRFSTEADVDQL